MTKEGNKKLIIFLIIGLLLMDFSFVFTDWKSFTWTAWLNDITKKASMIFMTVVLVEFIWKLVGGKIVFVRKYFRKKQNKWFGRFISR